MTWELKLLPLVQQASQIVLGENSKKSFKNSSAQIEANFIRGHVSVEAVRLPCSMVRPRTWFASESAWSAGRQG